MSILVFQWINNTIGKLCVHVVLKKEVLQLYVAVQAVKAPATVAKTARDQIGPRISNCANKYDLKTCKLTVIAHFVHRTSGEGV